MEKGGMGNHAYTLATLLTSHRVKRIGLNLLIAGLIWQVGIVPAMANTGTPQPPNTTPGAQPTGNAPVPGTTPGTQPTGNNTTPNTTAGTQPTGNDPAPGTTTGVQPTGNNTTTGTSASQGSSDQGKKHESKKDDEKDNNLEEEMKKLIDQVKKTANEIGNALEAVKKNLEKSGLDFSAPPSGMLDSAANFLKNPSFVDSVPYSNKDGNKGGGFDLSSLLGPLGSMLGGGGNPLGGIFGGGNSPFGNNQQRGLNLSTPAQQVSDLNRRTVDAAQNLGNTALGGISDSAQVAIGDGTKKAEEFGKQATSAMATGQEGLEKAKDIAGKSGEIKPKDELEALGQILKVNSQHLQTTASGFEMLAGITNAHGQTIAALLMTQNELQLATLQAMNVISSTQAEMLRSQNQNLLRQYQTLNTALSPKAVAPQVQMAIPGS